MKKINNLLYIVIPMLLLASSCDRSSVYSVQRKAEKKQIEDYIKRENIKVLSEFPADNVFAANEYVQTSSGLYFQLVDAGTGTDTVEYSDKIIMRYKRWDLTENSDTTSYWTTDEAPYPVTFQYGISSDESCTAWHEAIGYMKRNNSHARLIVESKLGFSDDANQVTPYAYEIKIKIQKN